jgi:hypothetical protein
MERSTRTRRRSSVDVAVGETRSSMAVPSKSCFSAACATAARTSGSRCSRSRGVSAASGAGHCNSRRGGRALRASAVAAWLCQKVDGHRARPASALDVRFWKSACGHELHEAVGIAGLHRVSDDPAIRIRTLQQVEQDRVVVRALGRVDGPREWIRARSWRDRLGRKGHQHDGTMKAMV